MMAKASEGAEAQVPGLDDLQKAIGGAAKGLPPIHLWNPPFCGDIEMRIARDGSWFYNGTPIGRPALVRLFASVLRKEERGYVLVTPVEKVGIAVEDAPFLAVEMRIDGKEAEPALWLRTNVEDWVPIDADHPLRFERGDAEGLKPYVRIRGDLWALVNRALFYDLVERGEARRIDGIDMFGIASSGSFFPMAPVDAIGFER